MDENIIYIDLDGVILDSEERMLERKYMMGFCDHNDEKQFHEYFNYTNIHKEEWDYIIRDAKSINDSVEIIKELQMLKRKIAILTKIHTLHEMKVKVDDLRNHRNINIPIIFVPPGIKKHEVVLPNECLLIDDSFKNINGWIDNGGYGLLFDENNQGDDNTRVQSLQFLLKR